LGKLGYIGAALILLGISIVIGYFAIFPYVLEAFLVGGFAGYWPIGRDILPPLEPDGAYTPVLGGLYEFNYYTSNMIYTIKGIVIVALVSGVFIAIGAVLEHMDRRPRRGNLPRGT